MGLGREDGPTVVWFKSVSSSLSCGGGGGSRGSVSDGPRPCFWGGGTEAFPHSAGRPPPCRSSQGARGQSLGERQGDTHPFSRQLGAQCARHSAGGHSRKRSGQPPPPLRCRAPRSTSLGEGRSFSPPPRRPGWQPTRARGPWGHHLLPPWVCVPPPAGASSLLTDRYKRAAAHLHRPPPPSAAETRAQSRDRARGAVQGHSLSCNQSDPLLLLLISATVSVQVWPQPLEFVK